VLCFEQVYWNDACKLGADWNAGAGSPSLVENILDGTGYN